MKSKGCQDVKMDSKHSGQGVGPLFSKQEPVVLPSGCGGTRTSSWFYKWVKSACRPSVRARMMTQARHPLDLGISAKCMVQVWSQLGMVNQVHHPHPKRWNTNNQ